MVVDVYVMVCGEAVFALGLAEILERGLYQSTKHSFGQLGFEQGAVSVLLQ